MLFACGPILSIFRFITIAWFLFLDLSCVSVCFLSPLRLSLSFLLCRSPILSCHPVFLLNCQIFLSHLSLSLCFFVFCYSLIFTFLNLLSSLPHTFPPFLPSTFSSSLLTNDLQNNVRCDAKGLTEDRSNVSVGEGRKV